MANDIFLVPRNSSYNSNLAIVRMLLAIYIFLFHLIPRYAFYGHPVQIPLSLEFGMLRLFQSSAETNPAVIAFITISGYCIHRNGMRRNDYNIRRFALKRAFRILPLLFLGSVLGWTVYAALSSDLRIIAITNTSSISLFSIFYKLSGIFAFIPYQFEPLLHQANGPLITCIVELWLYAFYPLAMFIIQRIGQKTFTELLVLITLLGAIAYTVFPSIASWWHNGSFFGFLIYWWIGAFAVDKDNKLFQPLKTYLITFAIITAILTIFPNVFLIIEIRKIMLALLVAILLRKSENIRLINIDTSAFNAGYSLYTLHLPLTCLALYYDLNFYVAFVLIISIAYISYLTIEKPMIDLGKSLINLKIDYAKIRIPLIKTYNYLLAKSKLALLYFNKLRRAYNAWI